MGRPHPRHRDGRAGLRGDGNLDKVQIPAELATRVNESLVGGASTITLSTTTVIIVLLVVILLLLVK